MNGFTELKDIRFPDTKANILLRGGMISRENLMNIKDSMITMSDVHFGIAKRINDVTSLEVKHMDEWRSVMCGDTTTLQSIYALTPSIEDAEKYEHKIFTDKVEIHSAQKIESVDEESVEDTESHEDVVVEDTHEEDEAAETTSDHDQDDDCDADESPEESPVEDTNNIDKEFVTGMTVGDTIEGSGIGTITVASDSTNNQGNARRQVNINAHGKHRRR